MLYVNVVCPSIRCCCRMVVPCAMDLPFGRHGQHATAKYVHIILLIGNRERHLLMVGLFGLFVLFDYDLLNDTFSSSVCSVE
jgi:hypothetical protein